MKNSLPPANSVKMPNYNVLGYDTRYWWLLLSGGILFIALGIWIILTPEKTYLFMSRLLSAGMLFTGLFDAFFSLGNSRRIKDWGWIFAGGVIDTTLGIYFLNYPLLSTIFMPMVIGIWMMFKAFMTISSPIALQALGIRLLFASGNQWPAYPAFIGNTYRPICQDCQHGDHNRGRLLTVRPLQDHLLSTAAKNQKSAC